MVRKGWELGRELLWFECCLWEGLSFLVFFGSSISVTDSLAPQSPIHTGPLSIQHTPRSLTVLHTSPRKRADRTLRDRFFILYPPPPLSLIAMHAPRSPPSLWGFGCLNLCCCRLFSNSPPDVCARGNDVTEPDYRPVLAGRCGRGSHPPLRELRARAARHEGHPPRVVSGH